MMEELVSLADTNSWAERTAAIRRLVAVVPDPELPDLNIEELGILRGVDVGEDGKIEVVITPTYSGCPVLQSIQEDVCKRLLSQGYNEVRVRVALAPAWTSDWVSEEGKRKLGLHGVAPPRTIGAGLGGLPMAVLCPVCGSAQGREISHFGSTQCQAVRQCLGCGETFPHFKEH